MTLLYCISHEEMVKVEDTVLGMGHETAEWDGDEFGGGYVFGFCEFDLGWATIPPPPFDMDEFILTVEEPSEEELAELNF